MDKHDLKGQLSQEIYFLTFAAGSTKLRMAGNRLLAEAIKSRAFVGATLETEASLRNDYEFWKEHSAFLTDKTNVNGWGKWLWKPYIIRKNLDRIPQNSLLLYLDAGCHLNLDTEISRERFHQYTRIAAGEGSLAMQLVNGQFDQPEFEDLREESWCPHEILNYLKVPKILSATPQLQAGILLFRNDSESRDFLDSWFDLMAHDNYKFLQDYSRLSTSDIHFRGHRYDQSVFSPLYKMTNRPTINDETWFAPNWATEGANFPIWGMRNKSGRDFRKSYLWNLRQRIVYKILKLASRNQ